MNKKCLKCKTNMVMVEYDYTSKQHYDGVSEHWCKKCGYRMGRWCEQELKGDEVERRHCNGAQNHPKE